MFWDGFVACLYIIVSLFLMFGEVKIGDMVLTENSIFKVVVPCLLLVRVLYLILSNYVK